MQIWDAVAVRFRLEVLESKARREVSSSNTTEGSHSESALLEKVQQQVSLLLELEGAFWAPISDKLDDWSVPILAQSSTLLAALHRTQKSSQVELVSDQQARWLSKSISVEESSMDEPNLVSKSFSQSPGTPRRKQRPVLLRAKSVGQPTSQLCLDEPILNSDGSVDVMAKPSSAMAQSRARMHALLPQVRS